MITTTNWIERDLKHVWHPCTQMKDHEHFPLLEVVSAYGSFLHLRDGRKIIDAISSWWCKLLGHGDVRLKKALQQQIEKFEHVILANTTNETIVTLSEKLAQLTQTLHKVFYASDGSSAIEIALKMSLHTRQIKNQSQRKVFLALENAYHGETVGAMSVSDIGLYSQPYASMLFPAYFIKGIPYVQHTNDFLWDDCEAYWQKIEKQLNAYRDMATAIIVEPIIQGASGMKMYSQDFLRRLRAWTKAHDIHLIADEIMTGIGRSGKMLACQHADIEPDFLCLAKNLTAGWLPFSAVLTRNDIYELFYDDYLTGKSFLHSHTFSGNALAASVALAVLDIVEKENLCARAQALGARMYRDMLDIAAETNRLCHVRSIGAIVAADLVLPDGTERPSHTFFQRAVTEGALLRPLGNTIYWLPPLTIQENVLDELKKITIKALQC